MGDHRIMAARPGSIRSASPRDFVGQNTKPASRVFGSREAAASLSASSTARAVSIIANLTDDRRPFGEAGGDGAEIIDLEIFGTDSSGFA